MTHMSPEICARKFPEENFVAKQMAFSYDLSTCNSDSSSSIFHLPYIAVLPIHMDLPLFFKGKRVSEFKLMAKVIGKSVSVSPLTF